MRGYALAGAASRGKVLGMRTLFLRWPSLLAAWFVLTALCAGEPAPAEAVVKEVLLSRIRQLTFAGKRSGEGYFAHDGKSLVFQSEREAGNPFYQIYQLDLLTGGTRRISTGLGKTTCAWLHPDGKRVLFASTHLDKDARAKQEKELEERAKGQARRYAWDYDEFYDLYVRDHAGEPKAIAPALGYDAEGSFSPDGTKVLFASNRHAYAADAKLSEEDRKRLGTDPSYFVELYLCDADGANLKRLTDSPGYDGGPFFSADGARICWRRFTPDGKQAEIWTAKADGSEPKQITKLAAMSWAPYFHPSGEYLIFATNLHGFDNFELYLADAKGEKPPVRVTETPGFDGLPAFSLDGKTLAWTSTRTPKKQSQLFLADWDDAAARQALDLPVAENPALPGEPPWVNAAENNAPAILSAEIRWHVEQLCTEEMGGRLTGTDGEKAASNFVAEQFKKFGLAPGGHDGGFEQPFEFTAGVSLGEGNALAASFKDAEGKDVKQEYAADAAWRPLAFSASSAVESSAVVCAGYGLVAPDAPGQKGCDSYAHLDVKDKWVLVFRFLPENILPELRQHWARFAGLRFKAVQARDRGAKGLIIVTGPNAQAKEALPKLGFDAVVSAGSLPVLAVTDDLASVWLKAAGKDLKALQDKLDTGEPQMGFALDGVRIEAKIDLVREKRTGRNVLARLQAGEKPSEACVLLGAHIDHLGRGVEAYSLAKENEKGDIHHGADDNASGIAALLEIAQYLAQQKKDGKLALKHDILFAAWSGEEMGLLGSSHFAAATGDAPGKDGKPSALQKHVLACLNLDMVGRLRQHLIVNGLGSSSAWPELLERCNAPLGVPLQPLDDSYVPSDATTFYTRGVPILSAFSGNHPEYHTPRDLPDTLNYRGAEDAAKLFARIAVELASNDQRIDYVAAPKPDNAGRAIMRVYLGTVPDYAAEVQGVKLSGVAKDGPAEKGGLKGGDVIVELAGKKIENIYDYTYAIGALKVGEKVKIVILRGAERVTLEVTPGSRE